MKLNFVLKSMKSRIGVDMESESWFEKGIAVFYFQLCENCVIRSLNFSSNSILEYM